MAGISARGVLIPPKATLAVNVGHDGLMDFPLERTFQGNRDQKRAAIILAFARKVYFSAGLRPTGGQPLLWTTGLMAPEAYTWKAALEGWMVGQTTEEIQDRAAVAYAKYQRSA